MTTQDKFCSIASYFKVPGENLPAFKRLCEAFVERASSETDSLYYGFGFDGETAYCREGYPDASGFLTHLKNVADLIQEALKIAEITHLEIHGPETELAKLRGPLADFKPRARFFTLECGFRR